MASLKDYLVAHYKLNDDAATAVVVDETGSYDGTYKDAGGDLNTDTGTVPGKILSALEFDGDEFVDLGDTFQSTFRSSWSISLWFKVDDGRPAPNQTFCGHIVGPDYINIVIEATGKLSYEYVAGGNSAKWRVSAPLLSDGQETWHHIVCVADDTISGVGGVKIYLDGALTTSDINGDTSGVTFTDYTNPFNFYLGGLADVADPPQQIYCGDIDNVMLFNKALTLSEIKYLYNNGVGVENVSVGFELSRTGQRFSSFPEN